MLFIYLYLRCETTTAIILVLESVQNGYGICYVRAVYWVTLRSDTVQRKISI